MSKHEIYNNVTADNGMLIISLFCLWMFLPYFIQCRRVNRMWLQPETKPWTIDVILIFYLSDSRTVIEIWRAGYWNQLEDLYFTCIQIWILVYNLYISKVWTVARFKICHTPPKCCPTSSNKYPSRVNLPLLNIYSNVVFANTTSFRSIRKTD